jgi:ATP-dependent helicase/nuclease subunit B
MNEGRVPASVSNDPWLGENARAWLGLITSDQRAARDAFLFRSMLEARRSSGKVDIFCAKSGSRGDTLLPSRLLLAAPSDELPERVQNLFKEVQPPESSLKWERDWQWRPVHHNPIEKIHVTSLRDYIACPFRFYLKHICRMNKTDPERNEWNSREFGNIVHDILEAFGKDPVARDSSDPDFIGDWLSQKLDETLAKLHGDAPPLAIRIQTEALRQRLKWTARIQAEQRGMGWQISETELPVELTIGGFVIRAKIDRIDRHEVTGALRVIDYKTGKVEKTESQHRKKITAKTQIPPHINDTSPVRHTALDGKGISDFLWINLQLPLYALAESENSTGVPIPCYIKLGSTEKEVDFVEWSSFTQEDLESAKACMDWIATSISQKIFWPPAPKVKYDYYTLLSQNASATEAFSEI